MIPPLFQNRPSPLFYQTLSFYGKNINPLFSKRFWKLNPPNPLYKGEGSNDDLTTILSNCLVNTFSCPFVRKLHAQSSNLLLHAASVLQLCARYIVVAYVWITYFEGNVVFVTWVSRFSCDIASTFAFTVTTVVKPKVKRLFCRQLFKSVNCSNTVNLLWSEKLLNCPNS